MARKDLMKGLMPDLVEEAAASPAPQPRPGRGAIGAVSRSFQDLKSRSVTEIDTALIDDGGLQDRLDRVEGLDQLADQIKEHGQQVPVLLRPSPEDAGRYQIVYGRRRVAALKRLGQPVKALVRDLDDRQLLVAQGQENSARKDLSFIEKANFARQLKAAGYDRKVICDALSVDKTQISRMLAVVEKVPLDLIEAIGAAPSAGRDRWLKLAEAVSGRDLVPVAISGGETSDLRFEAVLAALSAPKPPAPQPEVLKAKGGVEIARTARKGGKTVLTITKAEEGFDQWLIENLARLHQDWKSGQNE